MNAWEQNVPREPHAVFYVCSVAFDPLRGLTMHLIAILLASALFALDGDTIVVQGEHVRILNIDAPEIGHPKCDAELRLGLVAKRRMQALIEAGPVTLERGDKGRMKDRYGRSLARVMVNGQDVGETLISEGLARRWDGARHPWCGDP